MYDVSFLVNPEELVFSGVPKSENDWCLQNRNVYSEKEKLEDEFYLKQQQQQQQQRQQSTSKCHLNHCCISFYDHDDCSFI